MRRAVTRFVRDERTASALRERGLPAIAANVIADLAVADTAYSWPSEGERFVLLPGSRDDAYADAVLLMHVVRLVARQRAVYAMLSLAASLDAARIVRALENDGWTITAPAGREAFVASFDGCTIAAAWRGDAGALFSGATIVLGQAGTANEAAAAAGLPVVALETRRSGREGWYRMRQARLLGNALDVVPGDPAQAAASVLSLLDDPARRAEMSRTARSRMGPPGASAHVARAVADVARSTVAS
jgi:uncharacterized protein (TIGR03492 family)